MESNEELKRQRGRLAEAIGNAAIKAGIVTPGVFLNGPMLIKVCDDLAEMAKTNRLVGRSRAVKRQRTKSNEMEM